MDVQKSESIVTDTGPSGISPGDTVQYTLDFSVSDYFAVNSAILTDVLSDGLRFDSGFTPTLTFNRPSTSGNMDPSNYTVNAFSGVDGSQTLAFRVSDEMTTRTLTDKLIGACILSGGSAADCALHDAGTLTRGTVTFRAVVQQDYDVVISPGTGLKNVNQGDTLTDNVTVDGIVLTNTSLASTGNHTTDTSADTLTIARGSLTANRFTR